MTAHPLFVFFPALPLARTLDFGEWLVGHPTYEVAWRPDPFRARAQALRASFSSQTRSFREGAVLWHRDRGVDGTAPSADALRSIHAATTFAMLNANDHVVKGPNAGHFLATTENAALYVQPIDEDRGWITHRGGGLLREVLSGGWKIGEQPPPLPDACVPLLQPRPVSKHLARAVFDCLTGPSPDAARVAIALEWHSAALANSDAVSWQHRFIALKTAFEALTGTSKSHENAARLRQLFASATTAHQAHLPWAGLLWSPRERTDIPYSYQAQGKTVHTQLTEFEHWFMAFAEVRNSVIHEGRLSASAYVAPAQRPLSRYAGSLFWTAERVLREAIKAILGAPVLLCGLLADIALWQPVADAINARRDESDAVASSPSPAPDGAAVPQRSLAVLLGALKATAANTVLIERGYVDSEPDEDGTPSFVNRAGWGAKANGNELLITKAERDLLVAAGAEDELPESYRACE